METVDWEKIEALGYRRATRLRKIEHALVSYPDGLTSEQLCHEIGLTTISRIRTLQIDLNELRALYTGKQEITRSPHKLLCPLARTGQEQRGKQLRRWGHRPRPQQGHQLSPGNLVVSHETPPFVPFL